MAASMPKPDSKPLPGLPPHPDPKPSRSALGYDPSPPPLSLSATLHLRRLLSNALEHEHLSFRWLPHLENSLHALSAAVRSGHWTTGAREKRLALREISRLQPSSLQSQPSSIPPTPANTEAQPSQLLDSDWVHARAESDGSLDVPFLTKLEARIAESILPAPATTPTHLLITLAQQDSIRQFPELSIDFDLRPHREECSFAARKFSLPFYELESGERRGSGGTILMGYDEWKGASTCYLSTAKRLYSLQ